jgi:predicted enzyme involved in methoxymalonyl-ACP biosynthesis
MNYLVEEARRMGLATITASYIPTAKNNMVKEFYSRFNFTMIAMRRDGGSEWQLRLEEYRQRSVFIRPEEQQMYAIAD